MKRRISAFICLALSLSLALCSCTATQTDETVTVTQSGGETVTAQSASITLPYSSADSLNPFYATGTENSAAAFLYCQPLFQVKSDYSPEACAAQTYSVESTEVRVTIKEIRFSDGSLMSPADVVYSFNKAKTSSAYSERLKNVSSAERSGDEIIFHLSSPDAYALNILNFPIVKSSTAESADSIPTGSGAFMFTDGETLAANPYYSSQGAVTKIKLYDIKQQAYITNQLEIGNINYLLEDFSQGSYKRIAAQNKAVTLNNFVYLGMNSSYEALSSSNVRTAVYYAVDKQEVAAAAYQGYSKAASTPFNPDFYGLSEVSVPETTADTKKCETILKKLGYGKYTKSGVRTNGTYKLEFEILVNSDNEFRLSAAYKIAENLTAAGITASVKEVSSDVYKQRIASGDFQMYVGEIKLTENMSLDALVSGDASAGVDKTAQFVSDYAAFKEGTIDIESIINSFMNDVIFVPICYRCAMAAYSQTLTPDFSYAPYNIYGNIENWVKAE